MDKYEAMTKIAEHLEMLTDYDVIEATFADTLYGNLADIVSDITTAGDSVLDSLGNMNSAWSQMKKHEGDNDFGTP